MPDLLVDTNILVLLIVGTWDRASIPSHRRTAMFTPKDFTLLKAAMARYTRTLTTQPVLTEASNLMGNDFHEVIAETLVSTCTPLVEVIRTKERIFEEAAFPRLGFADASILAAADESTVVLTDDVKLYLQVLYQGLDAINFNHLRKFAP